MSLRLALKSLETKEDQLAGPMGLVRTPPPTWLADSLAISSLLSLKEKIDETRHGPNPKRGQKSTYQTEAYQSGFARTSTLKVLHRRTAWGLVGVGPMSLIHHGGRLCECVALRFRPHALASEPELLRNIFCIGEFWGLNRVFTHAIKRLVNRYRGPGKLVVKMGAGYPDAAVAFVICPAGETDWKIVGEALAALFGDKFDSATVKRIDRAINIHNAARRSPSATQ